MFVPNYLKSNQKKILNIERFYLGVVRFGLGRFVCLFACFRKSSVCFADSICAQERTKSDLRTANTLLLSYWHRTKFLSVAYFVVWGK